MAGQQAEKTYRIGIVCGGCSNQAPCGTSDAAFLWALSEPYIVSGQRTFMETCWLPAIDGGNITPFIEAMKRAISRGCALFTPMSSRAKPPTFRRRQPSGSAAIATGVALALPHAVDRI